MLPLNLYKKCKSCGFETNEPEKYFSKYKRSKDGLKNYCKKCAKKSADIYVNTEHGFLVSMFGTMRKKFRNERYNHLSEKEKDKHRCYVTWEEFWNLWEEHKKKFGYHCRLTGIKMVAQRANKNKISKFLGYSNGVSVDRLDPNIGYTKDNIIFVSNEANKNKGAVTKDMCIKILKLYEERGL